MSWYLILLAFLTALGAGALAYQTYKITELDAKSRGIKHPKLWGLISAGGQNRGGLLLYLIGRRKYPSAMSETDQSILASRKKKAGVSLILLAAASVGLLAVCIFHL